MLTYKDLIYHPKTKNGTINMFIKDIPNMFIVYNGKRGSITVIYFDPRPGYWNAGIDQVSKEINITVGKLNKEMKIKIIDEVNKFLLQYTNKLITTTF